MKIFVTGVGGQLGYDVVSVLTKKNHTVIGSDLPETLDINCEYVQLDITDEKAVHHIIDSIKPDAVIHCAAWTAVDAAEDDENIRKVFDVNETATSYIASACKKNNCKMLYISTDYVFGCLTDTPLEEDCKDFSPLNIYGKSKLAGEKAVEEILEKFFIVRISWVFGKNGNNFVKTMLKLSEKYKSLRVVCDQIGSPTYTADLAVLIADMIESEKYGYYHATNEGDYISWYDFACEIFRQADIEMEITPVTTQEYGTTKATRPKNSRLSKEKLIDSGFSPLPHWKDALKRYINEIKE